MEPEVVPDNPASLVGAQTALEEVSPGTVVATEMSLLPGEGSCASTAMTPTGTTGEEEHQTGIRGTREEAQAGGEMVDPDLALVVVMT